MALNLRNPNGYDGSPATQYKQGIVRFATDAEVTAGTAPNVAVTVAQLNAVSTGTNFASPPALGFGSTTPRPVHATTLDSTSTTSLGTGSASVVNVGVSNSTLGFFGATATAKPGATADLKTSLGLLGLITDGGATPLNLDGGALTAGTVAAATTITAGTTLTATLGAITATNGNLVLAGAGNKLVIAAAAPTTDSVGTTAAMVAGEVTITSSAITASSKIIYSRRLLGTTAGNVSITAQAGGSATLTSSAGTETSTFDYLIIN